MVTRIMSVREARANFSDLLGSVYYTKEPVIVERKGKPFAVVISPELYEKVRREEEADWAVLDRVAERHADRDVDEVLRDVSAEVEQVRQERHDQEEKATKGRR